MTVFSKKKYGCIYISRLKLNVSFVNLLYNRENREVMKPRIDLIFNIIMRSDKNTPFMKCFSVKIRISYLVNI